MFGDAEARAAGEVKGLWERSRPKKRPSARRGRAGRPNRLARCRAVPVALPALSRAQKLQDKASKVGFDWNDPRAVLAKIREEADEIEEAL